MSIGLSPFYYCSPIEKLWELTLQGHYVDIYAAFLGAAVINSVTDVVILLLPVWLLRPLRVKMSQKIAVGFVLMAGGLYAPLSLHSAFL